MSLERDRMGGPRPGSAPLGRVERVRRGPAPVRIDLADQRITHVLATLLLALMTVQILGPVSNVIQIAIILLLGAIHWRSALVSLPKIWLVLAYPLLALASTYWSSAPDITFRYSAQFVFTTLGAIMVAVSLGPSRFVSAVYLANALVALGSLFSGRYGPSMEGPVMIGLTGSKNQMALVSQLTIAAGVAVFLDKSQPRWLRASTLVGGGVALLLLIQAKSATGIITAIGAAAAFIGLMLLRQFPVWIRVAAVVAAMTVVIPGVVMKDAIVEQAARISTTVFKKDPTLTGRTYLWAQADRLIEQRPIVGHGYRSIWLGKSVTTQGLLRWAQLPDGKGFNFHNTFKEVTVDTGYVGLALFVFSTVLAGVMLLIRFLREGSVFWAFAVATYLTCVARAFAELVIGPFVAGAFTLFCLACYAGLRAKPSN